MPLRVCVLASGSSGNCIFIGTERTSILVDAGLPAAEITNRLRLIGSDIHEIQALFLTHAHSDHCRSAGTIQYRHKVPVFAPQATVEALARQRSLRRSRKVQSHEGVPDVFHDLAIQVVPVQHGGPTKPAGETVGFEFSKNGATVAVVTDLGTVNAHVESTVRRAQVLVIESNYEEEIVARKLDDPTYSVDWEYLRWVQSEFGHLSNHQCAELLHCSRTEELTDVFLAHLSDNHPDPRRDNNSFEQATGVIQQRLSDSPLPLPRFHRTYRRGLSNGQPSVVVELP